MTARDRLSQVDPCNGADDDEAGQGTTAKPRSSGVVAAVMVMAQVPRKRSFICDSARQTFCRAVILATIASCTPSTPEAPPDSLSAAISNPDMFVGRQVRISGFMYVSWEGGGLFKTPAELESHNTENAIELLIPTKRLGPLDDYDGTFGIVSGAFEPSRSPGWKATIVVDEISPIFRFSPPYKPTPADPENMPEGFLKSITEDPPSKTAN